MAAGGMNESGNRPKKRRGVKPDSVDPLKETPQQPLPTHTLAGDSVWTPNGYTAFKALMSARLCAAIWTNISDCDETFNYWEPLHYIVHGHGFQTWEYSPVYAIRSYGYLWLHILPLKINVFILQGNKILQFYFLRCVLAFTSCLCEVYFYKAVCKAYGANTGRLLLVFLMLSTGMYISSSALLPSSFSMYMTMLMCGGWLLRQPYMWIPAVAASTIIAWPFSAALGVPMALYTLSQKKQIWTFMKWSLISLVIFLVPLVQIDSYYYGGVVVTPLNIVLYNVFTPHGPDLYGTEPWSFYFLNASLNFNIAFPLALTSLPLLLAVRRWLGLPAMTPSALTTLAPMYLWLAIFIYQPHKEERFLFPIYPMICMAAAISLDHVQKVYGRLMASGAPGEHYTDMAGHVAVTTCVLFACLSLSRSYALYKFYHAPLDIYMELQNISQDADIQRYRHPINICVGKEWYRFPSNFFLPSDQWRLKFIRSEFKGQLPKPFGTGEHATRKIPSHMNDQNAEEPSRYLNVTSCHFLVDWDVVKTTELQPSYAKMDEWESVAAAGFMDASRTPQLHRLLYIPGVSPRHVRYAPYHLLRSVRFRDKLRRPRMP